MATSGAIPQPSPQSAFQRIINVFVSPKKAFSDLAESATWGTWVLPWLLVSAAWILMVVVGGNKIGFDQIGRNKLDMVPKFAEQIDKLPPQDRALAMAKQTAQTKTGSYAQPIFFLIPSFIVAAIMLGTFVLALGAKLTYKVAVAVVFLAGMPNLVKHLLGALTIMLGASPEGFVFENPIASNIGFFVNPADGLGVYTLLSGIDAFQIWSLILSALGFSIVTRKKFSSAAFVVFGWYVVIMGIISGILGLIF